MIALHSNWSAQLNVEYFFKIYLCKTKFYILVFTLTQV